MIVGYLFDQFGLSITVAGALGAIFGLMNLFSRASGETLYVAHRLKPLTQSLSDVLLCLSLGPLVTLPSLLTCSDWLISCCHSPD